MQHSVVGNFAAAIVGVLIAIFLLVLIMAIMYNVRHCRIRNSEKDESRKQFISRIPSNTIIGQYHFYHGFQPYITLA